MLMKLENARIDVSYYADDNGRVAKISVIVHKDLNVSDILDVVNYRCGAVDFSKNRFSDTHENYNFYVSRTWTSWKDVEAIAIDVKIEVIKYLMDVYSLSQIPGTSSEILNLKELCNSD